MKLFNTPAEVVVVSAEAGWTYALFFTLLFLIPDLSHGEVIISEFLAANSSILQDENQDYSDYIELLNTGMVMVSLDGYYLTDKADNLTKWRLPAVNLAAGSRLLIFASGNDRTNLLEALHTNFSLSKDGEYLGLVEPDGLTVLSDYSPGFPEQFEDVSYGWLDEGSAAPVFMIPSPGAANTEQYVNVIKPVFSEAHGFYDAPFTLHLSSETAGVNIYYTLDGSKPGAQSGALYNSSAGIYIDETRVVRAVAILEGYPASSFSTASYIFLSSVVNQSNNQTARGFPAMWQITRSDFNGVGKTRVADYEMDPDIPIQASDLLTVPSISIVLPQSDLWNGNTGIYVNSHKEASQDLSWERACSIEYIDPNSGVSFSAEGGLRAFGGAARSPALSDKIGMRIVFRSEYGLGRLDTDMFERVGPGANRINTLVLRSHWGSSFLRNPALSGWAGETEPWEAVYMRDVYANETYRATGHLNPRSMMVHLYLNGLYFGLYEAIERPDDAFNAENRGGDDEDYDVIKGESAFTYQNGALHSGSFVKYRYLTSFFDTNPDGSNRNPSTPHAINDAELEIIAQYLDLEAFCDHMISLWFLNRLDFPNKNWYAAAKRGEPGEPPEQPFMFFTWDSEATLWFDDSFGRKISWDERSVAERWNLSGSHDFGPVRLYRRLKLNEKFRQLWADRVFELMTGDGPLSTRNNLARWDALAAQLDRAIIGESARWGDWVPLYRDDPVTHEDWLNEVQLIRNEILAHRNELVISQMREFGIYPQLEPPVMVNAGEVIWPGEGVRLEKTGTGGSIQYTTDGSDPRHGGTTYVGPVQIESPVTIRFTTVDGSQWSAATEQTLIPLGGLPLAITEVMYHPGPTAGVAPGDEAELEFLEITNVGKTAVSLAGVALVDGVEFDFSSGTILQIGAGESVLVVRDVQIFEQVYGTDLPVAGEYSGNLNNGGERVALAVAGYVIQAFSYQDKEPWVELADGEGYSLELAGTELDPENPVSWRSSVSTGGTPGSWTAVVASTDPWSSVSAHYGLNWRYHSEYGTYYVFGQSAVYHLHHGWISVFGEESSCWWFDYTFGWLYTENTRYPYMYSLSQQSWLYHEKGSSHPRWFYNFATEEWHTDIGAN